MKKYRITPKQRISNAIGILMFGIFQLLFAHKAFNSFFPDEIMGILDLITGGFAIAVGTYILATIQDYRIRYNAERKFAIPVSTDHSILTDDSETLRKKVNKIDYDIFYIIYNVLGFLCLFFVILYLSLDGFNNILFILLMAVLVFVFVINAIIHSTARKEIPTQNDDNQ